MSCALYTILGIYIAASGGKPNEWIVRASIAIASGVLAIALYKAWAEQATKVDELTSRADITGNIYGNVDICVNPLGHPSDGIDRTRIVISALIVNKSPLVSPTIANFVCRMSLQDGEILEVPYERDLGNDYETTNRDEYGRQVGPFPSLAYFNQSGLVKDQHREGFLRFEVSGRFVKEEFTGGSLELIVIDGGGNKHQAGKIKWPYIREMVSE
jgi:hypothetical protein